MAVELDRKFATTQKALMKLTMKGRPLYFGIQAQAMKSGKFVASKKKGEVAAAKLKDREIYVGKDAEKKNKNSAPPAMGVITGDKGILTLHFEKGKAKPAATKFTKFYLQKEMKYKAVRKVVIQEVDVLPTVPEKSDLDDIKPTLEAVRERATGLIQRLQIVGGDRGGLGAAVKQALATAATDPAAAEDLLDDAEFLLSTFERLMQLEEQLSKVQGNPAAATEVIESIAKRLTAAGQQLDNGNLDDADENLDVAEQSLENLLRSLPADSTEPSSDPSDTETTATADPLAAQWQKALANIGPALKEALVDNVGDTGKMKTVLAYAKEKAEAGSYKDGIQSLLMLKRLIDSAKQEADDPLRPYTATASDASFQVRRLQVALRKYEQKLRGDLSDVPAETAAKIQAAMDGALEIADLLDKVVKVLEVTPKTTNDIDAVEKYMKSDIVVAAEKPNPFKLSVDISAPMNAALNELRPLL